MVSFKVGDKVRATDRWRYYGAPIKIIYIIQNRYYVSTKGNPEGLYTRPDEIQLIKNINDYV